jgi:hypothetical protein
MFEEIRIGLQLTLVLEVGSLDVVDEPEDKTSCHD